MGGAQTLVPAGFSGEGWWVDHKGTGDEKDSALRAIRLSDGKWVDAPPPKDLPWLQPFGVVDGEIWSLTFLSASSSTTTYSIARVPIASLGAPQP